MRTVTHRPPGEAERIRIRRGKALELRIAGANYKQIGRELQCSSCTAFKDVQAELGALDAIKAKIAERLRDLEVARCEKLAVQLNSKLNKDLDAKTAALVSNALIKVMERRARLLGLDAPTRAEHVFKGDLDRLSEEETESLVTILKKAEGVPTP